MKTIPLTQDKFAAVDNGDYEALSQLGWFYHHEPQRNTGYAFCILEGKPISMHAFIMGRRDGLEIDHKDRNGLNNQRDNLRWATRSQNAANMPKRKSTSPSKYKGVYHRPKCTKQWVAIICKDRKHEFLGYFHTEHGAARAYDKRAAEVFGVYACFNFE
jgi:hypothetical protein